MEGVKSLAAIVHNPQENWTVRTGIDVIGSKLNDTIVNGAYPEDSLVGAYGSDQYKGHNVCIWGNEGKDVILNHGYNVVIYGGDDNDSIRNFGSNVRINGNEGSDKFIISGASENNTITDFTDGEDELWFEQGEVTAEIDTYYAKHSVVIKSAETGDTLVRLEGVTSGSSNRIVWYKDDGGTMSTNIDRLLANSATTDSSIKTITVTTNGKLNNTLDNAIITATTGNNSIENSGNKITINGGSGNDTITNSGTDVKINGNDGDDSVSNNGGNNVTIDGGKGKDTIFSSGNDVSIFGGDEQDSIRINTSGTKVTVDGGNDNDDINNYSASALIIGGDGNDYLYNRGDSSTINGGIGDDEIHNFGVSTFVIGGSGKDEISNTGNYATIDSGDGNDSVDNLGSNVSINSGDGNDTITNRGTNATNITINSGGGDDSINNIKSNVTIISGSGDDTIYNDGSNVLIDSGTGNDSIHNRAGSNITFNYRNGDGNDTIDGLKEFPTISISSGSYSSVTSGNNVIIKVGEGSITLKDAKDTSLNIIGTYTPDTTPPDDGGDDTPTTYKTQQDVIKAFMHSLADTTLSGTDALNEAVSVASGGKFKDYENLITRFVSDCKEHSVNEFIKYYCSIDLNNDDTGAITGWDAGGIVVKTDESIVEENGELKEYPGSFTLTHPKSGLTLIWNEPENVTAVQKKIVQGLYSWWFKGALDLVTESYGLDFKKTNTANKIVLAFGDKFYKGHENDLAVTYPPSDEYPEHLILWINDNIYRALNFEKNKNGKGSDNYVQYLDSILAHEITHALMMANDSCHDSLPKLIREGMAELTIGTDNIRDVKKQANTFHSKDISKLEASLKGGMSGETDDAYTSGYMLLRYFAKQASNVPEGVHCDSDKTTIVLDENFTNSALGVKDYFSSVKTIDASRVSQAMTLTGNSSANSLTASKGGSEMIGGRGDDTLHGGNGSDTFVYASGDGNDVFIDVTSKDKIKLTSGTIDSWSINGTDIIFKIGSGSVTAKNARGRNITIIDSNGVETTKKYDNATKDDIHNQPLEINPLISSTISRISARSAEKVVTNIDSLDNLLTDNGTSILTFTENSGRGIQNVNLSSSEYPKIISLEGGNQNVQFNDENGNIAIVGENATGTKNIIFGNGNDLGIFYAPNANSNVTVGAGSDSILVDNNAHVKVDMNKSDNAKIIPYSGKIIIDNYNLDSRAEIIIPDVTDITSAIKDNSIQLIGNEVRPNSSTRIQLNGSTDANIVNLSTEHGNTSKVGFTGINGGAVDAHELRGNFLLKGNYAENASDKQKRKPSTLISGNGHDTILAGARDFIDGGNGRNQIFLTPYDLRQIKDGATIATSGDGRNTVYGFHEGFGYDGDVIQVKDFNNLKFKFDTDGLLLTANDSRIKFDGIGITSATTDDSTNSSGTNRAELIQITNGSSTMRTAVAQTNQSILVQEDDYITPNAFFGNRSGLNFSEYSGSVEINLADGTGKLGKWDATFKGINKLQAGNGMSTLIGDDTRNTLIAGTGYTSMWGGAGNDKLIGKGNSTDKDGRTTFFFFAGDGRDVISDFTFLTPENRYDGIDDRINVGDSDINDAYRSGNNVVVVFDQNSYLILEDAVGKDFQIANMIAKVDRNIAYDGLANCYVASGGSSLTVDSTVRSAEIWLDNSHGTQFFGNIRTLDASAVEGNTSLVGNEFDDTIIAGQGDSSLWGGFSPSNDLLIGGNSRNTFFYCMGNGNDTIQGTNDKDFIILSDVSLDQIIETSITADSVSIRFNDGGSLQIQGTSDVTYQLADGSKYSANHQRLEWDSR